MRKKYLIGLLFPIYIFWYSDQDASAQNKSMKFDHITIHDGLSSNRVNLIFRDTKDYPLDMHGRRPGQIRQL